MSSTVFPILRPTEAGAALQVGSRQSRVEWQNHLPHPVGQIAFAVAQDTDGLLCCRPTLPGHVQVFFHQHYQVLLHCFIPQPTFMPGVALIHAEDLTLGLVEH